MPVSLFHITQPLLIHHDIAGDLKLPIDPANYKNHSRGELRINTMKSPFPNWDNEAYIRIIDKIKSVNKVGISIWGEYPIVYNLINKKYDVRQINPSFHVSESGEIFIPDAIVKGGGLYNQDAIIEEIFYYNKESYKLEENCGGFLLYIKN